MKTQRARLIDQSQAVLAVVRIADEGGLFGGTIDLRLTPAHLQALFEEFEEVVNGQMFALLDEVQEKISSLPIRAVFDDGSRGYIEDLQVFPSTSDVSFRLAGKPVRPVEPA